jgi:hypothetical protein
VTWEHCGNHAKPKRRIAAILNPHWSARRVREYVEFIYVQSHYAISEQISYAKNRSFNPYPAWFVPLEGIPWEGQIICGHNPRLFARLVDNLQATGEPNEESKVVWSERPRPNFGKTLRELGIKTG